MTNSLIPPASFQFAVTLDGHPAGPHASFSEVSGIQAQMQNVEVTEGGQSRYAHRLPTVTKLQNLVLKRGVAPPASPLLGWCRDVIEGSLGVPIVKQSLRVSLLDEKGQPLVTWRFADAWPCKWEVDAFGAGTSSCAIELIEFQYASMVREDGKS